MARRKRSSTRATVRYAPRRRSFRRSYGGSGGVPLAVIAGFLAPLMDAYQVGQARNYAGGQGFWGGAGHQLLLILTGYNSDDKKFYFSSALKGWGPIIVGMMAHRIADKMGINRRIRGLGSPVVI